jgi:hypothetical protein
MESTRAHLTGHEQGKSRKMGGNTYFSQLPVHLRLGVQRLGAVQLQVMWDMLHNQVLLQDLCVRSTLQ